MCTGDIETAVGAAGPAALNLPPSAPELLYTKPPAFSLDCTELARFGGGASALGQEDSIDLSHLVYEPLPRIPGIWVISDPGDLNTCLKDPP